MATQPTTIEGLVAGAVTQKPLGTITIDGRSYTIDRPRMITHIEVSEAISRLPGIRPGGSAEQQMMETLRVARDCRQLGEIAAILLLGGKNKTEQRVVVRRRLFGLLKTKRTVSVDLRSELADKLLRELSPEDFQRLIVDTLRNLQLPVFFGVITSLSEVNLLKPTSEV